MTREELIQLANKIIKAEGTEEEVIANVLLFEKNVPDPNASDYLTQPEYDDLSPEQIVDKALSYKPIQL